MVNNVTKAINCFSPETDIYYSSEYIALFCNNNEEVFKFYYEEGDKKFYNISIKKPIETIGHMKLNEGFYDIETAYGFGGYFANTEDMNFIEKAIIEYEQICREKRIIAEFIRFHPFNSFALKHGRLLDFIRNDRETVVVDLTLSREERWNTYSSSTRRKLRRGQKLNLVLKKDDIDMDQFINLYYKTMNKNKADNFYYFNKTFFDNLNLLSNKTFFAVYYEKVPISMAVFLETNDIVYYFLGANNYDYSNINGSYFLFDNIFDHYRRKGKKLCFLGGGTSSNKNDTLLHFKSKFSPLRLPFYIGGKIFIKEKYEFYCSLKNFKNNRFLRYRGE